MKIRILSDLHLDFKDYDYQFEGEDVLVIAGDSGEGLIGLDWVYDKIPSYLPVLMVFGNHEYYGHQWTRLQTTAKKKAKKINNLRLLFNETCLIQNILFVGTTLWTDYNLFGNPLLAMKESYRYMNDFSRIYNTGYATITPNQVLKEHYKGLKFIKESLNLAKEKSYIPVVITHHGVSIRSVDHKFRNSFLSASFVSNLESLILEYQPPVWIHGHCHTKSWYTLGDTQVICNPRGYPHEYTPYDPVIFEIDSKDTNEIF